MFFQIVALSVLSTFTFSVQADIGNCFTPSPSFPKPDLTRSFIQRAGIEKNLNVLIQGILNDPDKLWSKETTSFAVQITGDKESLWESYYTAPILGDGSTKNVTGDTVFRIASISKSFTVYSLLLENGINLDDSISKYLPELLVPIWKEPNYQDPKHRIQTLVDWKDITIRALASQLSGVGRGTGVGDLADYRTEIPDPEAVGLPKLDENDPFMAPCQKNDTDRYCSPEEILHIAKWQYIVFSPNDRSTYSNIGFSLLGLALERATGKSFEELLHSRITKPLGMINTGLRKPDDSRGIIPAEPNNWYSELGPDNPSGGIFTTADDLSIYLRSILKATLLSRTTINYWMKPHSWTSSNSASAYGMPWEIVRSQKLTPDHRPVDIITKGGRLDGYLSSIALIPEFNLGITFLVAGQAEALEDLREEIIATLIPDLEVAMKQQLRSVYTGPFRYQDQRSHRVSDQYRVEFEVDAGPGLLLTNWTQNNTNFLSFYGQLKGMPANPKNWEARLIPSNIRYDFSRKKMITKIETWRLIVVRKGTKNKPKRERIFDDYCMTDVDGLIYGGSSLEEFQFSWYASEKAIYLELPGTRTGLLINDAALRHEGGEFVVQKKAKREIVDFFRGFGAKG